MNDYAVFEGGNTLTVEKIDDEKYEISVCSIRTGMSCATISRKAVQEFAGALNNLLMSSVLDIAEIDYMIELAAKNMKDKIEGRKQLGIENETTT